MTPPFPLHQLPPGSLAIVSSIDADEIDGARIKRMGICEGRRIQLVKAGDPMILRVVGTRVGLSARLAVSIHVEACEPASNPEEG